MKARLTRPNRPKSVGVIFSAVDLAQALRLRRPPDFFELRLDRLVKVANQLPEIIPRLGAPIIITARRPAEGGANNLSLARRRALLLRFLPYAAYLDVELHCAAAFSAMLKAARGRNVRVIFSLHALRGAPSLRTLVSAAAHAHSLGGSIFKIVTRTDRPEQLSRLVELVTSTSVCIPISAMGIGRLGRTSRALLAHAGSVLNYAHLGLPALEGQWSLTQLRAALAGCGRAAARRPD